MSSHATLTPEFIESPPEVLEDGKLYVSMNYATVLHNCCCGCGREVVTPLSPAEWKLFFDGETVSLTPSIGNWNFPCRSHYWVKRNEVEWAGQWSRKEIEAGRAKEALAKKKHLDSKAHKNEDHLAFDSTQAPVPGALAPVGENAQQKEVALEVEVPLNQQPQSWLQKVKARFLDRFFK